MLLTRASLLIFAVVTFCIAGCKKDKKDDPAPAVVTPVFNPNAPFGPKSALLTGADSTGASSKRWRFRKFLANGVPQTMIDPCLSDFTATFYTSSHIYTGTFTQPTVTCTGSSGNWNLNSDETKLLLFPAGQPPVTWQFIELSDTLLHYTTPAEINGQLGSAEVWMVPR